MKDTVPEAEVEEPVVSKEDVKEATEDQGDDGSQVTAKAADGKNKEEPLNVKEEQVEEETEESQEEEDPSVAKKVMKPKEEDEEFKLKLETESEGEEEAPPLIKRGRGAAAKPKKVVQDEAEKETTSQIRMVRKRAAAKPKEEVHDEEEEDTPPQVKQGRKRAAAKPKQEVHDEEDEDTPPQVKQGRKRAAAKPKQEVHDEEEEDTPPRSKPGRKRAPPKPKQKVQDEDEDADTPPQVKQGRKRAAAKPKRKVQDEEEEEEDIPPQSKPGRKRAPPKPKQKVQDEDEDVDTPPQIKQGRKRAAAKPKQKVQDEEEEEEDPPPQIKQVRKRAPPKPKQNQDEDEEEDTPPVQKGRKRAAVAKPRKKATNKVMDNATFVVPQKDDEEDESSPSSATGSKKKAAGTAKAPGGKAKPKAPRKQAVSKNTPPVEGKENTDTSNVPNKSGVKTGVERKVVVKGRAAVDAHCPIAQHSHVYEEDEEDDVIWDCMLNQTNIQFNNNKFYLIQLLEDDSSKTYSVWMRWGRVGANGQTSLVPCGSNLDKAKGIFEKKFSDKTKNDWDLRFMFEKVPGKYDLLKMDYSKGKDTPDSAAIVKKAKEKAAVECQLHPRVRAIIELICDIKCMEEAVVEMKYDANKAPLGKLTRDQIKAGYLALKRIDDLVESDKFAMKDLLQACNDFYTRVPHYFGMKVPPLIRTKTEIREKVALLEALGDIQAALSVLDQPIDVNTHPTDQHYRSLKCDLTPLEKDSEEYKILEKYMKTTHARTHCQYSLELLEVLACRKESEHQRFKDVGNRMLLWHGSRMSNWAGILSQGLRIAPPEAPVTGYMFGKGIYFADMASKSANYCWANASKNVGFLLLSEVALGESNELLQADYNADNIPKGFHSVKGCGRTAPQPENFTKLSDGTVVPMGPGVQNVAKNNMNYSLLYNEYIVYDPAQVRTRFLLKVKFNFK
ncbi:poly [ADP-ribose] polymerase 2-like isoform X2 [Eriocheir sinensis]|nr:poly [ADP-ribose] polymerase 2-like isoform X2 [Eriocheir sinensis]